ncbi:helix-turn-helix domain-containing protein [Flavobacterium capsici]|uniref:Helix-turn-helix transcriptional regulator n=1 Tax=Flavobacterium capsici TaxID=3075618 RepID=A0AA96F135_9FLAO|nr:MULTISPECIES: helix-turn-helix transcriptional regulator [unclassified Flavobacterium]WNM19246.1 helix-turn-helix transcriptional regulator [Flavobacterium sp. PMR2A8]WNM20635.1 helix-turn-helix transcriptional regulator [Flavobacterium sp. PMTSA4]
MSEKIYISKNIDFLVRKAKVSKDEFGTYFDLNRGVISQYIREISTPPIKTIIKICETYNVSIDDFIKKDLEKEKYEQKDTSNVIFEPPEGYGLISLKYVESLETTVDTQKKLLKEYEEKLLSKKKVIELA